MKLAIRNWRWLAGLMAAGLICGSYLWAENQSAATGIGAPAGGTAPVKVSKPEAQEAADSARLIDAVNAGNVKVASEILHKYGVGEETVLAMATRLGKAPARVELAEPFVKATLDALGPTDPPVNPSLRPRLEEAMRALDYERAVWTVRPESRGIGSYAEELGPSEVAPIAVMDVRWKDACFIRFIKWYDRYAEEVHSVVLNGPSLSNAHLEVGNFGEADRIMNALYQLIKARKPDAFVWLGVVKKDDRTDEAWLRAMRFKPDGLQISNLKQFHSPFAETRARYVAIVGADVPMMVCGFCGYTVALGEKSKQLSATAKEKDPEVRRAAEAKAISELGSVGAAAGQDFSQVETNLEALGYRGMSAHWLLLAALANSDQAGRIDKSDLTDPRVGQLDGYLRTKDYGRALALAGELITNSAPGDMDWMAGKLAEGMAWLSQMPPDTKNAITVLDEVLAVDFKKRPGRDHYILTAVRWRMHAAVMTGDTKKSRALAQWVAEQPFQRYLKGAFLKQHGDLVSQPGNPSK